MFRDHSVEAMNLAVLLEANSLVPVYHQGGVPTPVTEAGRTTLDWSNAQHELLIPLNKLEVRQSTQGEPCTQLVYANLEKPTWWNVVRVAGGVIEAEFSIPAPLDASLEIMISGDQLVTLRAGETKVKAVVQNAAKHIHNPDGKPLKIKSLNSNILYDIRDITMTQQVKDIGRLMTGHKQLYNWIS